MFGVVQLLRFAQRDLTMAVTRLTPSIASPNMKVAVLDGELAVPCTRNPLQRG